MLSAAGQSYFTSLRRLVWSERNLFNLLRFRIFFIKLILPDVVIVRIEFDFAFFFLGNFFWRVNRSKLTHFSSPLILLLFLLLLLLLSRCSVVRLAIC